MYIYSLSGSIFHGLLLRPLQWVCPSVQENSLRKSFWNRYKYEQSCPLALIRSNRNSSKSREFHRETCLQVWGRLCEGITSRFVCMKYYNTLKVTTKCRIFWYIINIMPYHTIPLHTNTTLHCIALHCIIITLHFPTLHYMHTCVCVNIATLWAKTGLSL